MVRLKIGNLVKGPKVGVTSIIMLILLENVMLCSIHKGYVKEYKVN